MSDEEKCIVLMRAAEAGAFRAALDERGDWPADNLKSTYLIADVAIAILGEPEADTWGLYFKRAGRDSMAFVAAIINHARNNRP